MKVYEDYDYFSIWINCEFSDFSYIELTLITDRISLKMNF